MLKLFAYLIHGCWHNWTILDRIKIFKSSKDSLPMANQYVLQCNKCGMISKKEV